MNVWCVMNMWCEIFGEISGVLLYNIDFLFYACFLSVVCFCDTILTSLCICKIRRKK